MRKRFYYQQDLVEKNGHSHQFLPSNYTVESEQGHEGGLNLGELLRVIRRRIFVILIGTTTFTTAAIVFTLTSTKSYVAKFELLTEPITPEDKVAPDDRYKRDETSNKIDETKVKILQSPKLMTPINEQVQKYYPNSKPPELKIKLLPNTQILEVSYQDTNPEKVLFVLNKAAEAYLKYSLEERQTDTKLAIQFVERQLPLLLRQVEILQAKLQTFRQKSGIINAEVQSQQLASELDQIVQKRLDAETQLNKTQAFYDSVQKQLGLEVNEAEAVSALSESPGYQKLLSQLQDVEAKIATKSSQYTDNDPGIQSLLIQQQNLLDLMGKEKLRVLGNKLSSINTGSSGSFATNSARVREIQKFVDAAKQIQILKTQIQFFSRVESDLRQKVKQFPILIRQEDDLKRQLKISVDNLNHFLTKRETLRIDAAQKQTPWQILTPPNKPQNVAPSIKISLLYGTVLGLLLSTGLALLTDKFNNVLYNLEEVKEKFNLPILGEIPYIKLGNNYQFTNKQDISHFRESFHSAYTNISLVNKENAIRSLVVISASPRDGKSTIALYLAQTAAAMGKRVLLVDANLRNPAIHKILDLPNRQGLSNLISEELHFENVIHQFNNYSQGRTYEQNLFILTSGSIPTNPTMFFSSPKLQILTEQFKQVFDLIIYDTSPFLGFADTSILTKFIDASILAVGLGKTNCTALAQLLEKLEFSSTPVLGAIATIFKK
ncbi:polysaccharide biosynthesis tyrosine autokinase [Anabaena azotica FACHB-119]|uniref:non-specific protein-tyrosine kinase n=2 Tax=Anabaena azotica TaxID=197653 RepID=A0ABR8D831_9NOST|nr:polysaccharide biosynthesis tyrosine autokinase [Anabaena azotica FACHB-119]